MEKPFYNRFSLFPKAFDINGMDYMMDDVVASGKGVELEMRVKCTHRFKSAVPAGNLARMGAYIGGGAERQVLTSVQR